jgi:hypothetical protein
MEKKGLLPDNPQKQSWRVAMHFAQEINALLQKRDLSVPPGFLLGQSSPCRECSDRKRPVTGAWRKAEPRQSY